MLALSFVYTCIGQRCYRFTAGLFYTMSRGRAGPEGAAATTYSLIEYLINQKSSFLSLDAMHCEAMLAAQTLWVSISMAAFEMDTTCKHISID